MNSVPKNSVIFSDNFDMSCAIARDNRDAITFVSPPANQG